MKSAHEFTHEDVKEKLEEHGYSTCNENVDKVYEQLFEQFGYNVSVLQHELPDEVEEMDEGTDLEEIYEEQLDGMFSVLFEDLNLIKE